MDLARTVYLLTRAFPREEVYGMTGQIRRAAVSVPSNIAEGHAREHLREYLHHLSIAQGSLAELETQLELALGFEYLPQRDAVALFQSLHSVARQLKALRMALERKDPGHRRNTAVHEESSPYPMTYDP
ncbi:MAG: four helix bundle protein [Chloroflexi bacterium]|nr:four helix bundle protein [Chloroflexota bacterium]